jgi:hypothetical protein
MCGQERDNLREHVVRHVLSDRCAFVVPPESQPELTGAQRRIECANAGSQLHVVVSVKWWKLASPDQARFV